MLPKLDGINVCKKIREFLDAPIIMLSAKKEDNYKILGIITDVDDYIAKLFNPSELVVRVKAQNRRYLKTTRVPVNVDPTKMVRVFENIISNSIRYSYRNSDINT